MKLFSLLILALFVATCSAQTCGDGVCSIDFAENAVNCPDDCDDVCPCRPYCEGRECGPDGCGGSCGTCPFPRACNDVGRCECDRNCIGKECGDDGCNTGDLCDFCGPNQICGADFLCTGACTPNCINEDGTRRQCGNDGCFGSCGECTPVPGQDIRCRDGVCTCRPQCDLIECGPDGCGGDCGACEGDAVCTNGFCEYPILGCCGDGICGAGEDVCSCPTDCPGCCVDGVCNEIFGEDGINCPQDCIIQVRLEIRVREFETLVQEQCSIAVTGPNGYSDTLTYINPSIPWEIQDSGYGSYTFTTECPSYVGETMTLQILEARLYTVYVSLRNILIEVRDAQTDLLVSTATIVGTAQFGAAASNTYNWFNPSLSWFPFGGYGSYQFVTSSAGYLTSTDLVSVTLQTQLIVLYLNKDNIPIIVEDCTSGAALSTSTVVVSSTTFTSFSATLTVGGTTTTFTHVGYGSYTFVGSATDYETQTYNLDITGSTTEVRFCLPRLAYCGDGVCNNGETSVANLPTQCQDCGRLRGVISLAVGQKDQLVNITIDVWAHPTNPALFLRRGEPVPTPAFSTKSDSKGFFSITTLSFDAQPDLQPGTYSRRFYFRLAGQFTDRTSGNDVIVTLLPLWWNYELSNLQWTGTGSLVGTNNSPSLYFYMTPPFSTDDALVRIILSWGTLISTPSASLPDLDLVIAGPVNSNSIATYGSGVVNFENKDLHATVEGLPYAKIITDQAQGYGPEVFDFYGVPGAGSLQIGFSDEYNPNAEANAYEVWVDRPNSSPNQDSAFTFMYDTNAFIVVYINDGVVNEQLLFDERTGVEYAYGFYNRDQWNQVPEEATLWHIIDISQTAGGIVFEGFPGEDGVDRSEAAGAKYSYAGGIFNPTKDLPCGHVTSRGVPGNLQYCPYTLSYPQTKK